MVSYVLLHLECFLQPYYLLSKFEYVRIKNCKYDIADVAFALKYPQSGTRNRTGDGSALFRLDEVLAAGDHYSRSLDSRKLPESSRPILSVLIAVRSPMIAPSLWPK